MRTVLEWYADEALRCRIAPEQRARRLNPERSPYIANVVDQSVEFGRSPGIKRRILDEGVAIESLQAAIAAQPDESGPILRHCVHAVLRQTIVHRKVADVGSRTLRGSRRGTGASEQPAPAAPRGHCREAQGDEARRVALRQGSRMT